MMACKDLPISLYDRLHTWERLWQAQRTAARGKRGQPAAARDRAIHEWATNTRMVRAAQAILCSGCRKKWGQPAGGEAFAIP